MPKTHFDRALRYGYAVPAVALAAGLRLLLHPLLQETHLFSLFYIAIAAASWLGGFGAGVLASVLGLVTAKYLFVPPYGISSNFRPLELLGIALYLAVSTAILAFGWSLTRAKARAEVTAQQARARQKKLEAELVGHRHSEEVRRQLAALVRSSEDAIIGTSPEGLIVSWNAGAERLYGYPAQEVRGRSVALLVPPGHLDEFFDVLERLRRGDYMEPYETVRVCKGGKKVDVSVRVSPIRDMTGDLIGASVIARDISERKRLEESLKQRTKELQEADRRKDEFLAMLAHELRNPLAPLLNAVHILKQPGADEAILGEVRDMMERQVAHLSRMVEDLLDVSRVRRGKISLRTERVELAPVLARAVETVKPLMEAQEHDFQVHVPGEPLTLEADPVRITQIITNLLTNAGKYTNPGGRITLTVERHSGSVTLRVRDSGIGIAPEMLPRIFDLFVQADHSATQAQGGLGIGLALVKKLVQMHGGSIEAKSAGLGRGSEFIVQLPLAPEPMSKANRDGAAESLRSTT